MIDQFNAGLRWATQHFESRENHFLFLNPGTRARELANCTLALQETGQDLLVKLSLKPGADPATFCPYLPAEYLNDDLGIYMIIPRLALKLGMPTYWIREVFFGLMIWLGFSLACMGWLRLLSSSSARTVALLLTFLSAGYALFTFDVYSAGFFAACWIPWLLVFRANCKSNGKTGIGTWIGFGLFALSVGLCEMIRSLSAMPILLFLAVIFAPLIRTRPFRRTLVSLAILVVSLFQIPQMILASHVLQRDQWLATHKCERTEKQLSRHDHWHSLLVGLAYLRDNPYGIKERDDLSIYRVFHLTPTLSKAAHEIETRNTYLRILGESPGFLLRTYFFKLLESLARSAPFWIPGSLALVLQTRRLKRNPEDLRAALIFLPSLLLALLPPLVAVPIPLYQVGFVSIAAFFSSWAIARRLEPRKCPKGVRGSKGKTLAREFG